MESESKHSGVGDPHRRICVVCPECKQAYKIAARLIGRRLVCKACRREWRAKEVDLQAARAERAAPSEPPSDSGQTSLGSDMPPMAGSSSVAIDTSWIGRYLGRYKVISILGQGGMGVVWRGHDEKLRRDVALKILGGKKGPDASAGSLNVELFMQEARAVAKLQHPSVVSIFEVAEHDGHVFLALELMEGGTLKEYVERRGPIPAKELFELMVGPAKALYLAHGRHIVHRDIKPGNLMFDDHRHLKLMDFGLADVRHEKVSAKIRGRAVGSLGWIAPETARGQPTTEASDIFGMGLVILYALTGKQWLHAKSRSKLVAMHQNPPPLDLSNIPGLTARGSALLRKCLAVEPKDRFASAGELAEALQACADEDPHLRVRQRRSSATLAFAGVLAGAVITLGVALYFFSRYLTQIEELSSPTRRPIPQAVQGPSGG